VDAGFLSHAWSHEIERFPDVVSYLVDLSNEHEGSLATTAWQRIVAYPVAMKNWEKYAGDPSNPVKAGYKY